MLDVKLELPRVSKRNPDPHLTRAQYAVAGLATAIRRRMLRHGSKDFRGHDRERHHDWIADGYTAIRGSSIQATGATMFLSSWAARHGVSSPESAFSLSGGMWSGLSVLQRGAHGASIQFRGRSTGQTPKWKTYKSDGSRRARTMKVSNALKAWTVLNSARVNILALTDEDLRGTEQYVMEDVVALAKRSLGAKFGAPRINATARAMLDAARSHRTQPTH